MFFFWFDILWLGVDDQPISLGCENTQKTRVKFLYSLIYCVFLAEIINNVLSEVTAFLIQFFLLLSMSHYFF